ncbi:unnamed protein product [Polarella glacialis]|uniref:Uncharacterized protein n=1 Tax=Polarella glacialis TaxID=89957 RepID=A0A813JIH7_POLGL|nr:unnamed protein product [Polarella glacialis]
MSLWLVLPVVVIFIVVICCRGCCCRFFSSFCLLLLLLFLLPFLLSACGLEIMGNLSLLRVLPFDVAVVVQPVTQTIAIRVEFGVCAYSHGPFPLDGIRLAEKWS